jgi:transaldolase
MGPRELADAKQVLEDLAAVGADLEDIASVLEDEGVASFAKSFDDLIDQLRDKAARLTDAS